MAQDILWTYQLKSFFLNGVILNLFYQLLLLGSVGNSFAIKIREAIIYMGESEIPPVPL
jgi:hypothetical protein